MTQRNKYLPLYIFLAGSFFMSIGYNILLSEEIKLLQTEKEAYKVLENHWFHKYIELRKNLKFLIDFIDDHLSKNIT